MAPRKKKESEQLVYIEWDGRDYPVPDYSAVTFRENQLVKKVTGLRVGELQEAFEKNDSDAVLALFLISKMRMDGDIDIDAILDTPVLEFTIKTKDLEDETVPTPAAEAAEDGKDGAAKTS